MASKNTLQIIIESVFKKLGFDDAEKSAGKFGKTIGGLNTILAGLGLALTTKELADFATTSYRAAAQAERLGAATDNLAKGIGQSGQEMVSAITGASQGTIDQLTAMSAANKAMMFGLVENSGQMADLTRIAVTLGAAMGQDATKSIDDLTTALGRQSPMILDNLGITLKMEEAHRIYAAQLGKSVDQLTEAEQKQAFVNAALEKGRERVAELGGVSQTAATETEKLTAAWADFQVAFGSLMTGMTAAPLADFVRQLETGASAWKQVFADINTISEVNVRVADKMAQKHQIVAGTMGGAVQSAAQYEAALAEVNDEMAREAQIAQYTAAQMAIHAASTRAAAAAEEQLRASIERSRAAMAARYQGLADLDKKGGGHDALETMAGGETLQPWEVQQQGAEDAAEAITTAFQGVGDDLANTISSVIQPTLQEVWNPDQDTSRVDEWARRMATVATQGLGSEWLPQLQEQFGGQDWFQPIADALASGDTTGAMEAAKNALTNNVTAMYDKELIKQKVREKLQNEQLRDELVKEVQAELGAEGIAVTTGVIASAAGDASTAQAEVKTGLNEVETAATTAADSIKTGFDNALPSVDIIISRIRDLNSLLTETASKAREAGGAIGGLNPPTPTGNSGLNQMGGFPEL